MTEPRAEGRTRQTFYVVWAIAATLLGLMSTALVVFLFFQLRAGRNAPDRNAGWSRWEVSAGGAAELVGRLSELAARQRRPTGRIGRTLLGHRASAGAGRIDRELRIYGGARTE